MIITAAQRIMISTALGPGVMQAVNEIQYNLQSYGRADAKLWRDLLQVLHDGAGDAIESPLGMALQMAIHGKIGDPNGNGDASLQRRKPGSGFPDRRQF
jgi:hypothetical protein